jgi:hypothetical protein
MTVAAPCQVRAGPAFTEAGSAQGSDKLAQTGAFRPLKVERPRPFSSVDARHRIPFDERSRAEQAMQSRRDRRAGEEAAGRP